MKKRKCPYGPILDSALLYEEAEKASEDDYQWKEWSILVLYTLCESEMITVEEKQKWANSVFEGDKKAYEALRSYTFDLDISMLRKSFSIMARNE